MGHPGAVKPFGPAPRTWNSAPADGCGGPDFQRLFADAGVDIAPDAWFVPPCLRAFHLPSPSTLTPVAVDQAMQQIQRAAKGAGDLQALLVAKRADLRRGPVQPDQPQEAFSDVGRLPQTLHRQTAAALQRLVVDRPGLRPGGQGDRSRKMGGSMMADNISDENKPAQHLEAREKIPDERTKTGYQGAIGGRNEAGLEPSPSWSMLPQPQRAAARCGRGHIAHGPSEHKEIRVCHCQIGIKSCEMHLCRRASSVAIKVQPTGIALIDDPIAGIGSIA